MYTIINEKKYGNTYYGYAYVVESINKPDFSNYDYGNTVSSINNMLGNTSYMIQNYGNMRATISTANKAISKNHSSIISYTTTITDKDNIILINQQKNYSDTESIIFDFGSFASVGTYKINIIAIDSRGFYSSVISKTFYILEYHIPTLSVMIDRVNNFEQEIELSLYSVYSNVLLSGNPKNSIQSVQYRYKETGATEWGNYQSISFAASISESSDSSISIEHTQTNPFLTLPSEYSYEFEFIVSDKITSVSNKFTLAQGIPIFLESEDGHIGIGMVPDWNDNSLLQVGSDIIATDGKGIKKPLLKELSKIIAINSSEPTDQYR